MSAIIFTNGNYQAIDDNEHVVANGTLIFNHYKDGTPAVTYKDSLATISNPYEIGLSASGKADVYLLGGEYEVILKDADGVVVRTIPRFVPFSGNNGGTNYAIREEFTATANQTDFLLNDTPVGTISVYVNGVLQDSSQYSLIANTLSFSTGLSLGDKVIVDYSTTSSGGGGGGVSQVIVNERNTVLDFNAILLSSGSNITINGGARITQSSGFNDNGNSDTLEVLQSEEVDVGSLGASNGTNYLYRRINTSYSVSSTKLQEPAYTTMLGNKVLLGSFDYLNGVVTAVYPAVPTSHLRDVVARDFSSVSVSTIDIDSTTLNGRSSDILLTGRIDGTTLYISSTSTAP